MRFAIPNPPRKVRLSQVPGAVRRLAVAALIGLLAAAGLGLLARLAADSWVQERRFLSGAEVVPGIVAVVRLPAGGEALANADILYGYGGLQRTASRLPLTVQHARELRSGSMVELLVSPDDPDSPREATLARAQAGSLDWLPYGLVAGVALGLAVIGWELRRTLRADLEPLRRGLLVWLTPDGELPDTRAERVFGASYYREDVKYAVRARVRPGRAPIRNGLKLLATVVPNRPRWARVIDEDLAKALGWWA